MLIYIYFNIYIIKIPINYTSYYRDYNSLYGARRCCSHVNSQGSGRDGTDGHTGPTGPSLSVLGANSGSIVLTDVNNTNQIYYSNAVQITNSTNENTINLNGSININNYIGTIGLPSINLSVTGPTGPTTGNNLYVNGSILPSENKKYSLGFSGTDPSNNSLLWEHIYVDNLNAKSSIYANEAHVGGLGVVSDYRIKENIKPLDETFTVKYLNPVTFTNMKTNKLDIGLLAHEVQEYFPELVDGVKDGSELQSVHYTGLIPILIKEIQDLHEEIESIKKTINELKI